VATRTSARSRSRARCSRRSRRSRLREGLRLERGEGILLRICRTRTRRSFRASVGRQDAAGGQIVTYLGAIVRASTRVSSTSGRSSGTRYRAEARVTRGPGEADISQREGAHRPRAKRALRLRPRARPARLCGAAGCWTRRVEAEKLEAALAPSGRARVDSYRRVRAEPEHTGSSRRRRSVAGGAGLPDAEEANDWAAFVRSTLASKEAAVRDEARPFGT